MAVFEYRALNAQGRQTRGLIDAESVRAARVKLRGQGIFVQAIRPPTVPVNAARLRLTVHADWADGTPQRLAAALEVACAS